MTQDDNDIPPDFDTFWTTMNRRVADLDEVWRDCTSRRCRRARRCIDTQLSCARRTPASPVSETEAAETRASLRQILEAEMRRRGVAR